MIVIMEIFKKVSSITNFLNKKHKNNSIGFVPTMGALHKGHLELIKRSKNENDITVCSIFVNPTQFNDINDYKNYPVNFKQDIKILKKEKCDILFLPPVEEIYPKSYTISKEEYDFGCLEKVMEGKHRPGHFKGVAQVVERLFNIIKADNAYFGEKDFQQLLIIKKLVREKSINTNIIACPTVRDKNGLALSSRNLRLTDSERNLASKVYNIIVSILKKGNFTYYKEISMEFFKEINKYKDINIEYFEIADEKSLKTLNKISEKDNARIFVAFKIRDVRLIDNVKINSCR